LEKTDRWILQWLLGLTDKAFQNVLRDSPGALETHARRFVDSVREVAEQSSREYGPLSGNLEVHNAQVSEADWGFFIQLCGTRGFVKRCVNEIRRQPLRRSS
jgi:hypothetical protein